MKRQILHQLQAWQRKDSRKPLILMGARQVGKTTVLQQFASESFDNFVYLNFEDEPHLQRLFDNSLNPSRLLQAIEIEKKQKITPESTLIIFDEVQECPNALNSLKYFQEDASQYPICAAGSLLGVKLKNKKGFPVGKVDFLHMFPMGFLEFLEATGEPELKTYLDTIDCIEPLSGNLHEKLMQHFRFYLFIGGMPEAVARYIATKDLFETRTIHKAILQAYALDFSKHAPGNQIMKINQVWRVIPSQLAKENKKFIYSVIRKGARAKEFEQAIQWLVEAGLVYKTFNITTPKIPIDAYANFEFFKLYLSDVGLLAAMANLEPNTVLQGDLLFQEFHGAFIENYAAQTLTRNYENTYYWSSEGSAELDFIFQHEGKNYPLEMKAGTSSRKKSLLIYDKKYKPSLLVRSSPMNLKQDGRILNCPLYLLSQLPKLLQYCTSN